MNLVALPAIPSCSQIIVFHFECFCFYSEFVWSLLLFCVCSALLIYWYVIMNVFVCVQFVIASVFSIFHISIHLSTAKLSFILDGKETDWKAINQFTLRMAFFVFTLYCVRLVERGRHT